MRFPRRPAYWLRLSSHHAELRDELGFHREMIERDLVRRGMSPAETCERARRRMGNETYMREKARAAWLWPSLEAVLEDAAYTLRDLRRNPIFTVGVVLTLALGIGANASILSLVDRLLSRAPADLVDPAMVHRVFLYRSVRGQERVTGGVTGPATCLAWAPCPLIPSSMLSRVFRQCPRACSDGHGMVTTRPAPARAGSPEGSTTCPVRRAGSSR